MRRKVLVIAALALALAGPAAAQLAKGLGVVLKPKEVEAALFGIDMEGYSPTYKMSWRECIEPGGKTLYETPDDVRHGRLVVAPDGQACFSYEDDDYSTVSCFTTYKTSKGLRFEGLGSIFLTTKLVTGVKTCERQLIG